MIRHLAYHVYGCSVSGKGSCESYRRKVNIIKVCNLFCKPTKVDCIYIAIAVIPKILMPVWSYVGFARPVSIIQYAVLKECIKLSISTNHSIIFAQDRIRQQLSSLTMQTFRILLREVQLLYILSFSEKVFLCIFILPYFSVFQEKFSPRRKFLKRILSKLNLVNVFMKLDFYCHYNSKNNYQWYVFIYYSAQVTIFLSMVCKATYEVCTTRNINLALLL